MYFCRVCTKVMEVTAGSEYPKKIKELLIENAQLTGSSNDLPAGFDAFYTLRVRLLELG